MQSRRRPLWFAVALVSVLALVPIVTGSYPPVGVCEPCDEAFARAIEEEADIESVSVAHSRATVLVHANGSATWRVRIHVRAGRTIEELRQNPVLVDRVARETLEATYAPTNPELLAASTTGRNVSMRYRSREFTRRTFGVLRADYLRDAGGYRLTRLGADRLAIVPPEGYVVTSGLPDAEGSRRRLVLTSFESRPAGPFVVFATSDSPANRLRTILAIAAVLLPRIASNLFWLGLVPAALLSVILGFELAVLDDVLSKSERWTKRLGGVLGVVGAVVAVTSLAPGANPIVAGYHPSLVSGGIAVGVVGLAASVIPSRLTAERQLGAIAVALLVGVSVASIPSLLNRGHVVFSGFAVTPALATLPAGFAMRRERGRRRMALFALAPVGFVLGSAATFPVTATAGGAGSIAFVLLVAAAIAMALLAIPFLVLGLILPDPGE